MNPHPDPNVLDGIAQDIEYLELKIKSVLARCPEHALENAKKQLALLKESKAAYEKALEICPLVLPLKEDPQFKADLEKVAGCGIPSHYANPQDLNIAKVPDSYYYESLTKKPVAHDDPDFARAPKTPTFK
jgi:hypothetical protein